jgi:cell division protein FtsN
MPKDYKDSPAPRGESRLNHPLLLGIIIGLLLGVVISLAVALWLNRLSNPFVDKGKVAEPLPKIAPAQPPPPRPSSPSPWAATHSRKAPSPTHPSARRSLPKAATRSR